MMDDETDLPSPLYRPQQPNAKQMGPEHPKIRFLAMATLLIVSSASGFFGGWLAAKDRPTTVTPVEKQQIVLRSQGELISNIAKTVGTSVVSIETTEQATRNDPFGFGAPSVLRGAGTGIILTEDGLIITNRHVVPVGTNDVRVILSDGTEFDDVSVVGRTSSSDSLDVAFVKIKDMKGKKLTPAKLGDSSKMQVGAAVVAIGNALGQFQNTVTSGIISGYGRSIQALDGNGTENLEDLFQTDAAINSGNSGGPLVNIEGEVIGINTAVAGDGAQNIGFAIPINDVAGLINSVKQKGKLERPYLGVVYIPLTNDLAEQYGLSVKRGAYIPTVAVLGGQPLISGGPADKAGLKAGDIITKIDDKAIDETNSLSALVNKHAAGDKVTLTVMRGDKEQKITVTLGVAPTD
jgi:serine protease Do